jgi:N-acetyl-anhydromuramyl-L-alanine amidase AmpD
VRVGFCRFRGLYAALFVCMIAAVGGIGSGATAQEGSLDREFAEASKKHGVPKDLLKAMGYVNTRWEMPPPDASAYEEGEVDARGAYGVMALLQNPSTDTVGRAAELTGSSEEEIKGTREANVRGGAAVLADLQGASKPDSIDGWYDALAEYGEGSLYADQVFEVLKKGASARTSSGERLTLAAHPEVEPPATFSTQAAGQYPGSQKYSASDNYTNASRPPTIDKVVIHVTQGSWSSAINWFANSSSNVSAHYTIRSSDGFVGQSVWEQDIGWHAGNWSYNQTSIGIEHEGYVSQPRWFTDAMYRSSAKLTAYLCKKYNIPVDRQHIVGHNEVPGATHTDPGGYWNWTKYMDLVRGSAASTAKKTPLPGAADDYDQVADNAQADRFKAPRAWGTAAWSTEKYGADYRYLDNPLDTRDPATFKLDVPRTGSYEVFAWWSADPSRSARVTYTVATVDGRARKVVDQRERGGRWVSLGTYEMEAGEDRRVSVQSTSSSDGKIIADAVGLVEK